MTKATLSVAPDATAAEQALDDLLSMNSKGGKTLLKDPDAASHNSWHLWLPPHFNTSLDLKYILRQQVKNKEVVRKWKEWAQGSSFCFNEGAIIYDRDISGLETWGDKLDAIDFYIVLGATQPVSLRASTVSEASTTVSEASTDEGPGRVQRHPGSVNFKVFVPTNDHRSTFSHEHTVTQDQFVRYAISGSL